MKHEFQSVTEGIWNIGSSQGHRGYGTWVPVRDIGDMEHEFQSGTEGIWNMSSSLGHRGCGS